MVFILQAASKREEQIARWYNKRVLVCSAMTRRLAPFIPKQLMNLDVCPANIARVFYTVVYVMIILTLKVSWQQVRSVVLKKNQSLQFKVCKSVHHHSTIQIDHQPDATIFQFIILTFIYSSTCFGRFPAHHQELNDCSSSLWFYLRIVVIALLCSWSGRLTRGCHCSHWAPDDGRENAGNMLSCK